MIKRLIRFLNFTPIINSRTLTVCASAILLAACATDNAYDPNAHSISNQRSDTSYNSNRSHSRDIWQRVRDNYGMPDLVNDEVLKKEDYYATRADYVNRMASRSGDFMYLIMNEVERRRMPSEIALLPFVESAFVTTASSPVKAAGLWQFMPATGRDFSLEQNRFADQRNDVVASTDAALTFLQRLHDQFGDWHLALAAYNWGPGNVTKAVRRAQAAGLAGTYEDIKMPLETKQYVPKLQAIKNIVSNPERFGISLPTITNDMRHEVVSVTRDIDLTKAAELAGMDLDSFKRINPAFKKPVIAAALGSKILIPANRAETVRNAFSDRSRTLATLTTYSTYNTETLADIAAQFNTDEYNLRALNNIPEYHSYVKAGSTLLVPRTSNKASQDIPYQALSAGLTTTTGGLGFGTDYTVESPIIVMNTDETTRQERSGITNAINTFNNSAPLSSGPGLAFNTSNDDLSQLIKNNTNSMRDPVAAAGALIVNSNTRHSFQAATPAVQINPTLFTATTDNIVNTVTVNDSAPSLVTTPVTANTLASNATTIANTTSVATISTTPIATNVPLSTLATAEPTKDSATNLTTTIVPSTTNEIIAINTNNDFLTPLSPEAIKAAEMENIAANQVEELTTPAVKANIAKSRTYTSTASSAHKTMVVETKAEVKVPTKNIAKVVKVKYTPAPQKAEPTEKAVKSTKAIDTKGKATSTSKANAKVEASKPAAKITTKPDSKNTTNSKEKAPSTSKKNDEKPKKPPVKTTVNTSKVVAEPKKTPPTKSSKDLKPTTAVTNKTADKAKATVKETPVTATKKAVVVKKK